MFTKNNELTISPRRPRGRPRGLTPRGSAARLRLYSAALELMAERGYAGTTLRDVAGRAGASVGLLYRYFPSKRSVLLQLYDELSTEFAAGAAEMPDGRWRDRFMFALRASLGGLTPHREILKALVPVLVGDPDEGLFAPGTAFSRVRVQGVFNAAVSQAVDAPRPELAASLGRLLYLLHLAVLLWWLLDKSPGQRATSELVGLIERSMPRASLAIRLPMVSSMVRAGDALFRRALFDDVGV